MLFKTLPVMSKTTMLFLFFFASAAQSFAQSDENFWARVQAGYGLNGSGDRSGYVGNLSGGWYFQPRFKAGFGFGYAGFDNGVYEPAADNKARAVGLELNAFYNVVNAPWFKVEIGAGPHVQFWDWNYRAASNTTIFISGPDITILPGESVEFDETQLGYNASLGLIITPTKQLEFGIWGLHQNGLKGNNISTIRVGAGFKL
jgi:hypothetical protein